MQDKIITTLPAFKRLKEIKTARRCLTTAEIERVAAAAKSAPMTGQMVHDFILLMAFSGGRWRRLCACVGRMLTLTKSSFISEWMA